MARLLESRIPLTLGTAPFGTGIPKETAFTIMDSFLDRGGNILDTAAVYGMGVSEQTIGEWMKSRGTRHRVILSTKGGHPSLPDWSPPHHRSGYPRGYGSFPALPANRLRGYLFSPPRR